ncbi:MAG: DUF4976 domain-containing protein [Verrucomicrobia bacterium]|nr:DUF4976 domain-containing protein [Verrucomicrobiota bacterium]
MDRVCDYPHRSAFELYDLDGDPGELSNLCDGPRHLAVKAELVAKLKAFQAATRDPWLHKWKYE